MYNFQTETADQSNKVFREHGVSRTAGARRCFKLSLVHTSKFYLTSFTTSLFVRVNGSTSFFDKFCLNKFYLPVWMELASFLWQVFLDKFSLAKSFVRVNATEQQLFFGKFDFFGWRDRNSPQGLILFWLAAASFVQFPPFFKILPARALVACLRSAEALHVYTVDTVLFSSRPR